MVIAVGFLLMDWLVAVIALAGWGLMLQRLAPFRGAHPSFSSAVWLGMLFALSLLQLLHFVVPIQFTSVALFAILGVFLTALRGRTFLAQLDPRRFSLGVAIAVPLLIIWLAFTSFHPAVDTDTSLYHLQYVRWIQQFPVVPGLANLHGRLAFNSAAHLFDTALAVGPFSLHATQPANGFWLLLLLLIAVHPFAKEGSRPLRAYWLALMPLIVRWAFTLPGSLTTDMAPFALLLVATAFFVEQCAALQPQSIEKKLPAFAMAGLLVIAAITFKLSAIAYAAVFLVLLVWLSPKPIRKTLLLTLCAGGLLLLGPWIGTNVLLSGCLIYPIALTRLPLPWSVPPEILKWDAYAIHTWAKWGNWPVSPAPSTISWVKTLAHAFLASAEVSILPLLLGFPLIRKTNKGSQLALLALPLALAAIFWLATAPDLRFFVPFLWLLLALIVADYAATAPTSRIRRMMPAIAVAVSLILSLGSAWSLAHDNWREMEPLRRLATEVVPPLQTAWGADAFPPLPTTPLSTYHTAPGLTVFYPSAATATNAAPPTELHPYTHYPVGDAPLPASPYVDHRLRLRHPDAQPSPLAGGFFIQQ